MEEPYGGPCGPGDAVAHVLGLSCRFPESASPSQFWENLIGGRDMTTEDGRRWPAGVYGTPKRFGKLPGYEKFDAAFFAIHARQAEVWACHSTNWQSEC
jgi:fatty acid synthase